jgi:hypothetical protein
MASCTKCPHGIADESGNLLPKHRGRRFEDLPCATCTLAHGSSTMHDTDRSNAGHSTIRIDQGDYVLDMFQAADQFERTGWGPQEHDPTVCLVGEVLRAVVELSTLDVQIYFCRVRGDTYAYTAKQLKIAKCTVFRRYKAILAENPILAVSQMRNSRTQTLPDDRFNAQTDNRLRHSAHQLERDECRKVRRPDRVDSRSVAQA